ncbi:MAG: hypothetical protein PCFJNLEI_03546 [Verrucomicrobiae bacterium]|nr:hypothetical protein [Verrucomicrobiae bacterium]
MKLQVFAVLAAVGILAVNCPADEAAKGVPKIAFDRLVYDFGKTSLVTKLEGVFIISNAGDAPLEKLQVKVSCGCTSAPLKTDKLAPGEKTELAFTLSVNAMMRGVMAKHITVTSNDPQQPSVNLTLKAEVVPVYEYNPQVVNLSDLRGGSTTNVAVTVKRTDGKPVGLTKAEGATPQVRASLAPSEGAAESATIQIEVAGEGSPRRFNDSVRVFGENATQPLFVIPVTGRIVGDLALSQEMLFWGVADRDNWPGPRGEIATTRKIAVSSSVAEPQLELSHLTSSVPELKVELRPVTAGKAYELIAVLDKLPKESTSGTIKFDTNLKSQPTVEIKVTINILKRG